MEQNNWNFQRAGGANEKNPVWVGWIFSGTTHLACFCGGIFLFLLTYMYHLFDRMAKRHLEL